MPSRYIVDAVGLDPEQIRVTTVRWAEIGRDIDTLKEPLEEAPVEHVVFALERGDEVRAVFVEAGRRVDGGRVRIKARSRWDIELARRSSGRTLRDLPRLAPR
ncbi:MAG TPA: hypothetical protein VG994_20035 [Steroidobacteraceae bacterium]|nr:hypothetical protein [Steroidobacteraceae bacterium]